MAHPDRFLLPAYIVSQTIGASVLFSAARNHTPVSYGLVAFLSELTKLSVALAFVAKSNGFNLSSLPSELLFSSERKKYIAISIPAALSLVYSTLYTIALQSTTPLFIHVTLLAEPPITAILHHILIRPKRSIYAWISLSFLSAAIALLPLSSDFLAILNGTSPPNIDARGFLDSATPFIGLLIASISSLKNIYTETLLKSEIPFWVTQTWYYSFGSLATAALLGFGGSDSTFETGNVSTALLFTFYLLVVSAAAGTGLFGAAILGIRDNLLEIVAKSAGFIVIICSQTLLFGSETMSMRTTASVGILLISTWTYYYYQQSREIDLTVDSKGNDERPERRQPIIVPTRRKILVSCIAVGVLTIMSPLTSPKVASLPPSTYTQDIERFFIPHNTTPAEWVPGLNPPRCAWNYIRDHHLTCHSAAVLNWERIYLDTGCPVFPIPDGGFIFHSFWIGPWGLSFDLQLESFLATQRLGDGHRMIFWYLEAGPPESTRKYFEQYSDYIEFRRMNLTAESEGTCLNNMPEWTDPAYRRSVHLIVQGVSNMVRILLLAKYGGVWIDADMIFLRDLTPLLRMGPSAVGLPNGRYNNAILVYGRIDGGIGQKVLQLLCRMPFNRTLFEIEWNMPFNRTSPDKEWHVNGDDIRWGMLYNDGISAMCEDLENCGLGLLPAMWTDGVDDRDEGIRRAWPCDNVDFAKGIPRTLKGLFTLHTRMELEPSDECIARNGTLGARLRGMIREMLDGGLDLGGRDVIPTHLW